MTFGPINVLPIGFPNLFGMTGQALPKGFVEDITPVLDMLPFFAYANCREIIQAAAINPAAVGFTSIPELIVPDTEAWLVLGCNAGCVLTGAQVINLGLVVTRGPVTGPNVCPFLELNRASSTTTGGIGAANLQLTSKVSPFLMYAGDSIALDIQQITGGPVAIDTRAAIFRFTV